MLSELVFRNPALLLLLVGAQLLKKSKLRFLIRVKTAFCSLFLNNLCVANLSGVHTNNIMKKVKELSIESIESYDGEKKINIGYTRVSKREQLDNAHALEQQQARVEQYGVDYVVFDIAPGRKKDRKQLMKLMKLVRAGKVERVVITRIDRITRSTLALYQLCEEFIAHDVSLVALDQNIDFGSPQGRLMIKLLGILAEWEVELLSERVRWGKKHQRNNHWANGSCPFGYVVQDHKYVLDQTPYLCLLSDRPESYLDLYDLPDFSPHLFQRTVAQVARDCVDLFFEAKSFNRTISAIYEKYGVIKTSAKKVGTDRVLNFTKRGFSLWIQNPVLGGDTAYNTRYKTPDGKRRNKPREEWTIIKGTHSDQRLLQSGDAEEIQIILKGNRLSAGGTFEKKGGHTPYGYQSGLVYCAECDSRCMVRSSYTKKKSYQYFGCRHYKAGCLNRENVRQDVIENKLIEAVAQRAESFQDGQDVNASQLPFKTDRLQQLEQQLAHLDSFPGFNPQAKQFRAELQRQIAEESQFLKGQQLEDRSIREIILAGQSMGIWKLLSNTEKTQVFRRIIHRTYIRHGQVIAVVFSDMTSIEFGDSHESA